MYILGTYLILICYAIRIHCLKVEVNFFFFFSPLQFHTLCVAFHAAWPVAWKSQKVSYRH